MISNRKGPNGKYTKREDIGPHGRYSKSLRSKVIKDVLGIIAEFADSNDQRLKYGSKLVDSVFIRIKDHYDDVEGLLKAISTLKKSDKLILLDKYNLRKEYQETYRQQLPESRDFSIEDQEKALVKLGIKDQFLKLIEKYLL